MTRKVISNTGQSLIYRVLNQLIINRLVSQDGKVSGYKGSVNRGHGEFVVRWKSRNRGSVDQWISGSVNSEHKGPEEQ